jgi:hypothetical protein
MILCVSEKCLDDEIFFNCLSYALTAHVVRRNHRILWYIYARERVANYATSTMTATLPPLEPKLGMIMEGFA